MGAGADDGGGRRLAARDRAAAGDQPPHGRTALAQRRAPVLRREPAGSQLDLLEPLLRELLAEWPQLKAPRATEILRDEYGYGGSVELVKRHLGALRPPSVRPAQRTGYRPGQVLQLDWAELPTRPTIAGRERRFTRWSRRCPIPAPRPLTSAST